jgi:para-nitrobenzyl esterase
MPSAVRPGALPLPDGVMSTCRDEHKLFQNPEGELAANYDDLSRLIAQSGDDVLNRVLAAYGGRDGAAEHPRVGGDAAYWYPSVAIAEAHSAVAPTRMFRVDHAPRLFG